MNSKISDKDKKDWKDFINSDEGVYNKDLEYSKKKNYQIRSVDLHGYSLDQANKVIQEFIYQAYKDKINKLIVVTGKGLHSKNEQDPYVSKDLGILKHSVPQFIKSDKNLMQIINKIEDAKIEDGGSGAFYIFLKKIK